jgi:glycolate oxidase FAD binding subunit
VLKVAATLTDLPAVLRAAEAGGATAVSRAALGLSWIALEGGADLAARAGAVRSALPDGASVTVLDGGAQLGDAWPAPPPAAVAVMQRIKARFDPARVFPAGVY